MTSFTFKRGYIWYQLTLMGHVVGSNSHDFTYMTVDELEKLYFIWSHLHGRSYISYDLTYMGGAIFHMISLTWEELYFIWSHLLGRGYISYDLTYMWGAIFHMISLTCEELYFILSHLQWDGVIILFGHTLGYILEVSENCFLPHS